MNLAWPALGGPPGACHGVVFSSGSARYSVLGLGHTSRMPDRLRLTFECATMGATDSEETAMMQEDVAAVMGRPISQELLGSSIPARLAYVGIDGDPRVVPVGFRWDGSRVIVCTVPTSAKVRALQQNPRVALTVDTDGRYPPHVLLVRGAVSVELVDGVPDDYIEASRKLVPAERFEDWEAGVRALYAQMARITIEPDWAKLLDFETTIPQAVEDLVRAQQRRGDEHDQIPVTDET